MANTDPFNRHQPALCSVPAADTLTPSDRYAELFRDVQLSRVFEDSKTFADCVPRKNPEDILTDYRIRRGEPDFDLAAFVNEHFERYEMETAEFASDPDRSLTGHIDYLWKILTRHPGEHPAGSSLLPLPHEYVVPGGRFTELYYWDSYFIMLGLEESGCHEHLRCMADNFAYLIETYGHVPNGNRTYYLSRSQPPVFVLMTELFEEKGVRRSSDYLPHLHREYAYWMEGQERLREGEAHSRCVRLADGVVLNRYWDDRDTPRDESYWEDIETANKSDRPHHEVYRDLRAGAESGWDFSSRWLATSDDLSTIRTTCIRGLECYGHVELAEEIEERWLELVTEVFEAESKLVEKYDLSSSARSASGGEYPLQDGFGWSNGVTRRLMQEDPEHRANRCRAGSGQPKV